MPHFARQIFGTVCKANMHESTTDSAFKTGLRWEASDQFVNSYKMGRKCIVCSKKESYGVRLFSFPCDAALRGLWQKYVAWCLGQLLYTALESHRVCSLHFPAHHFIEGIRSLQLKKDLAVPCMQPDWDPAASASQGPPTVNLITHHVSVYKRNDPNYHSMQQVLSAWSSAYL